MSAYVIDASVAIKWMLSEPNTPEALRLRASGSPLHAPALLDVELASVLLKKVRQRAITLSEGNTFVTQLPTFHADRHHRL